MSLQEVGRRLQRAREKRGLTQQELARKLRVHPMTVSKWERGEQLPNFAKLEMLVRYLDLNLHWLFTGEGPMFRDTRTRIREALKVTHVPLLNRVPAGPPYLPPEDYIDSYIPVPAVSDPEAFALRVEGDSMSPRIESGDIVVVSPNSEVLTGDLAVVRIRDTDEVTLKRVRFPDPRTVVLLPENPAYEPIVLRQSDVEIIGKVVLIVSKP